MIRGRHLVASAFLAILAAILLIACRAASPLEGSWHEIAQISCEDGQEVIPDDLIGEVHFERNGRVRVTWHPFETYYDYRARYKVDGTEGTLTLTNFERINYLPEPMDGIGGYELTDDGRLILSDIWLGSWQAADSPVKNCGHILERLR